MLVKEYDPAEVLSWDAEAAVPSAAPQPAPSPAPEPTPVAPEPVALQEFDADEILALQGEEPEGMDAMEVLGLGAMSMYDPKSPAPDKPTYFANKALISDLQKQGVLPQEPGTMEMVGQMISTVADGVNSALWKYDPDNEGTTTWRNLADLATLGAYSTTQGERSTFAPGMAIAETIRRSPATLQASLAWTKDFYQTLARGLAAKQPKYRVKETGEFVYPGSMMPDAGMGDTAYDLVQMYQQQGKTLEPVTKDDLDDLEYQQFLQQRDQTGAMNAVMETDHRPEIVSDVLSRASAGFADTAFGTKYLAALDAQDAPPMEGQSMLLSMVVDPGVVATGAIAPVKFGATAALKGATARTLDVTARMATAVGELGGQGAKGAKLVRKAKRIGTILGGAGVANVIGGQSDSEEVQQVVGAMNTALGAYTAVAGGAFLLRGYGKRAGQAAYMLRESIGPGNAIDKGARAAVAVNPDVPLRYKDPLVRPSFYTSMESTPARLSKDPSLSPRARKFFGTLADWRAVQAVRLSGDAAAGATKGTLANLPFSEPLRAAGEDEAANLMLGMGVALGAPIGAATRLSRAGARRLEAADSDVGRMLAEVQQLGETVPRKRANPDSEVMRTLTETELAGGDVSAMMRNLTPEQLNEFAAVQGYFRDTTDFVPLNAADFEANRGVLNPNSADPIFLHAPDGERPRVFVNVEDARAIKAGDLGRAFLKSESLPERQVAAMTQSVDTLYTPEQIAAREREIARAAVEQRYAKQGVKVGPDDPEVDLRLAMLRSQSQTELGNPNAWSRQAIAAEDLSRGIVDWNRMRRGLPKGNNPITFLENVLGAQARGLQISGVRIDPETGRPLDTPDSLKRTNPAAADDPAVAQGLKNYTEGHNKMRRDPANETPVPEPVSPERAAAIELSMTDAPMRARQIMDLAGGPDGPTLTPDNATFGWRQEGNRRILAGRSLPDRVRYANHWKPHLEMIDTVQAAINDATPVAVRFDALGPSADVTKRPGPQYGATTREGVLVRWQATTGRKRENYKGGGELNVLLADMTTLRNRAINVLEAKHPTLDPSRGGPGYSLAAIMADAETYIANKGRNADPGTGLTPERLRVAQGLIEYGPDNVFGGLIDKDGIWRTPRLELIESVTPTGRRGHNMVGNNADGTFTQPPPKPMPDMGSDVVPPSTRFRPNLRGQSGAIDLSIITDLFGEGTKPQRAPRVVPDADLPKAPPISSQPFKQWFGDWEGAPAAASKVVDSEGRPQVVYHGTQRPDRIDNRFRKNRATSGPMAFFSDSPEISSGYAKGKTDTSIEAPTDYAGWFKFKGQGMRSAVNIDQAWNRLTPEKRQQINERIYKIGYENADEGSGPIVANSESPVARDTMSYYLRETRGNGLKALVEVWLNSGMLFGDERAFMDVLKAAGLDSSVVKYADPNAVHSAVFPVYLSIKNPLNTASIPTDVASALEMAGKRKRAKTAAGGNPDAWDKNTISGKEWLERLRGDRENGTTHAWTSIPDWVTATLKELGYDGIKDSGGKYGGPTHSVWIPFDDAQVKSATGNRGTFSAANPDIRYGIAGAGIVGAAAMATEEQ